MCRFAAAASRRPRARFRYSPRAVSHFRIRPPDGDRRIRARGSDGATPSTSHAHRRRSIPHPATQATRSVSIRPAVWDAPRPDHSPVRLAVPTARCAYRASVLAYLVLAIESTHTLQRCYARQPKAAQAGHADRAIGLTESLGSQSHWAHDQRKMRIETISDSTSPAAGRRTGASPPTSCRRSDLPTATPCPLAGQH